MTPEQITQFTAAAGHAPLAVLNVIALIIITLLMLWVVWIGWGHFRAWNIHNMTVFDLTWGLLRATILLLLLGFFLRP